MLNRKIIREKQAKEWTEKMQQDYAEEIQQCIRCYAYKIMSKYEYC